MLSESRLPDAVEAWQNCVTSTRPRASMPRVLEELKKLRDVAYSEVRRFAATSMVTRRSRRSTVAGAEFENVLAVVSGWNQPR